LPEWAAWNDVIVPKAYPSEFRDGVVGVARSRGPGVRLKQVARDFEVHPMTLRKWIRRADVDGGTKAGQSRTEAAEICELRKRNRLLEQEAEVLRRASAYLSESVV
jgi:transposase-like protein